MKARKDVYSISEDKKVVNCDLAGAMFVCRDTDSWGRMWVFPAAYGLKKHAGCVEYGIGTSCESLEGYRDDDIINAMCEGECEAVYLDSIDEGADEAWLAIPVGKNWHWYRVDDEIDFS